MKKFILTSVIAFIGLLGLSQEIAQAHKAIVKDADERFELKNFSEAKKNFSQLISYYPSNAEFNYKFGVCNVVLGGDPNASIVHLSYAQSAGYEKDVDFYLGRAYHRNYDFNKAIKAFQKYKIQASKSDIEERDVDRYVDMCRNGKGLLNSIKDVVVLDKKQGTPANFFRFYDLQNLGGKILAIPEELKSKQDKKEDFNGVFYFNGNSDVIYYASYGKTGETGKDIYQAHLLPNGKFGRVSKLKGDINSKYDEDYAFLHADGRTMYFSSKGHTSMGGFDVFRSSYDEGTSTFRDVVNMDFAVNTPDDDIFYIADSLHNNAWFSSSRNVGDQEMNVYNVKVEGIPINLIFIKGNFIADFNVDIKNAQIVMKDELTGKIVSKVNTNSSTGDYILSLTKPGLYKIEVNADNNPLTHQGYVQIPIFDEAVALGQELRLINEAGQEKLIINNSFDLPLDADISELSKEFLRRKSGLEITPEEDIIAAVPEDVHVARTTENAVLSAGFTEGTTVDGIIADSRTDVVTINQEIEEIKTNNKAAFAYALAKQTEADSKLKESQDKFQEAEGLEGNDYRAKILESNRLLIEAEDLSTDAKAAYRIAKRSEKIADSKKETITELENRIAVIEKSNQNDDFKTLTGALRDEKNRINNKKGELEMTPGEIADKEARELEDLQETLLADVKLNSDKRTSLNARIDIKKSQLAKMSKKKEIEAANNDIATMEEHLVITTENLTKTLKEVKKNGTEEVILKKEAEFFKNQYISPEEIYLADMNTISSDEVDQKLSSTNQTITQRKRSFGSNPQIVEVISQDYPEALSWSQENSLESLLIETKSKRSDIQEENLENYQVMIAIEKEVVKIENEKATYLENPKNSKEDSQYEKLVQKGENLELQHNDIYAQQLSEIELSDKDVDDVVIDVDPRYNAKIQEKLAVTNEVEGFYEVREYRKELKDQLVYMAEANKQDILKEQNPRNLKKLIKKDLGYQSAINNLDNQINDVNLFVIAYDTENKEIIDSNRPNTETLPLQTELTENYIATLEKVSESVGKEMRSGVDRKRKEGLREIQYELSNEIIDAQNKLVSYNSDLDLTISTEGEFADSVSSEPINIEGEYVELPTSQQGTISSLRNEYSEVFSKDDNTDLSMNDKIVVAIDKKLKEQKARLDTNISSDDKAIIKLDMLSLVDIRKKVEAGEYVFVNYQQGKTNETAVKAKEEDVKESVVSEVKTKSDNLADNNVTVPKVDNDVAPTQKESIVEDVQKDIDTTNNDAVERVVEDSIENASSQDETVTSLVDPNASNKNSGKTTEGLSNIEDIDNQVAEAIKEKNAASIQMENISFAFAKEKETPGMEAYGQELFDEAEQSFKGTENEFVNLTKIRSIQAEIVALENAVIDGEVKNKERQLNKKFENLYSDLAYEEIKLANRLATYTSKVIENQELEIDQLKALNKGKIADQDATKAKIKMLNKEIETWQKNAESRRFQIIKSNDELERNFLAREAFAMESDIVKNQQKIIYLYSNADRIGQLDDKTIDEMKAGSYVIDNNVLVEDSQNVSAQVSNDLEMVKKGDKLMYSDAYVNYIGHLEVLKIKMDQQAGQEIQLNNLSSQIHQEESAMAELENEFNHASNKKERRTLLEKINAKQTHLDKLVLDKNNMNEKVVARQAEINADFIKAEFLYSNGQQNELIANTVVVDNVEPQEKSNVVDNAVVEDTIVEDTVVEDTVDANKETVEFDANEENQTTQIANEGDIDNTIESPATEEVVTEVPETKVNDFIEENNKTKIESNVSLNNTTTEFQILSGTKRKGAIEMNTKIPSGVVYRIQIGAFSKPVDSSKFTEFTPLSGESVGNGVVRYYVGWFNSYDDAQYVLKGVKDQGYSDAFVVAYVDQKKSNVGEAIQKSKEVVTSKDPQTTNERFDKKALMSYYNSFPNAVNAELIIPTSGLFYTVQIGVFSQPLTAQELGEDKDLNIDILANKKIRYSSGRFEDLELAKSRNEQMHQKGFNDSFVTAYYNGKRISVSKAKDLFGNGSNSSQEIKSNDSSNTSSSETSNDSVTSPNENADKSVDQNDGADSNVTKEGSNPTQVSNTTQNTVRETPVVTTTVVTQTSEHGAGVKIIQMEYDVLIGSFGDEVPANLRQAINNLKATVEVKEMKDGAETVYYTARVKSLQEARNIQKDFENAGFEGTEVRAFRVE